MPEYLAVYDTSYQCRRGGDYSDVTGGFSRDLRFFEASDDPKAREMAEGEVRDSTFRRHSGNMNVETKLKLLLEARVVEGNFPDWEEEMRYAPEE